MITDFKRICMDLDMGKIKCKKRCCVKNKYLCARNVVKQYISKADDSIDKNRLLLLKSECRDSSFVESYALLISIISMAICALSLLFSIAVQILGEKNPGNVWVGLLIFVVIVLYCIVILVSLNKHKSTVKWKNYILTAIEEFEKEI